ncbi:hypothetical protein CTAM01_04495 [Colletotrichum tamarilloi]|uniref:Uncharacterized protein n=1 Tax=Colletotrichum tamarilloi TaxID=1209934 RepID=A0ABQ9RI89_9PEZI|nr:uncharacterized protein CTAM01_04495 [Colletotrichum tamarilloi]KAK1504265.1 hypothetical protein CTAM01_04495 [Colletotrichum tamarilloi]
MFSLLIFDLGENRLIGINPVRRALDTGPAGMVSPFPPLLGPDARARRKAAPAGSVVAIPPADEGLSAQFPLRLVAAPSAVPGVVGAVCVGVVDEAEKGCEEEDEVVES